MPHQGQIRCNGKRLRLRVEAQLGSIWGELPKHADRVSGSACALGAGPVAQVAQFESCTNAPLRRVQGYSREEL